MATRKCEIDIIENLLDVQEKRLKEVLPSWLEELEANEGIAINYSPQSYTTDEITTIQTFFNQKVKEVYGETFVEEISLVDYVNGTGFRQLQLNPDFSFLIKQHLLSQADGSQSVLENSFTERENNKKLLVESYKARYENSHKSMYEYMTKVVNKLQKLVKNEEFEEIISNQNKDDILRDVRRNVTRLKSAIQHAEFEDSIKAFVDYILLAANSLEVYDDYMNNISDNGAFEKLFDIYQVSESYREIFEDLTQVVAKDSPVGLAVFKGQKYINSIKRTFLGRGSKLISDVFFKLQDHPRRLKNIEKKRKQLEYWESQVNKAREERNIKRLDLAKQQLTSAQKELEKAMLTPSMIQQALEGKLGDISYLHHMLYSASMSPDLVISSFGEFYRSIMDKLTNTVLRPLATEFEDAVNKYYKSGEANKNLPEEDGKKFLQQRTKYYYDYTKKEVVNLQIYDLLHDIDPKFYEEKEEIEANIERANDLLKQESSEDKRNDLETYKQQWRTKLYDFNAKHESRNYTDEYYKPQRELEEKKISILERIEADVLEGTLLNNFNTFEEHQLLNQELSYLYNKAEQLNTFKQHSPADLQRIQEIRDEKSRIRSVIHQQLERDRKLASAELTEHALINKEYDYRVEIAETLSKYLQDMNARESHELVVTFDNGSVWDGNQLWDEDMSLLRKMLDDEEITEEQFREFRDQISERVFDEAFSKEKKRIEDELKEQYNQIRDILGLPANAEFNNRTIMMQDIVRKYRDNAGMVNGELMKPEEQELVTDMQEERDSDHRFEYMDHLKSQSIEYKGKKVNVDKQLAQFDKDISNAYANRKRQAAEDIRNEKSDFINFVLDTFDIKALDKRIEELKKERRDLEDRIETQYYKSAYTRELNNYINTLGGIPNDLEYFTLEIPHPTKKTNSINQYKLIGRKWHQYDYKKQSFVPLINQGDIANIWRQTKTKDFENESTWFQRNHLQVERWDKVQKKQVTKWEPSYVWMTSVPKGVTDIESNLHYRPGFRYKRKIVKDSIRIGDQEVLLKNDFSQESDEYKLNMAVAGFKLPKNSSNPKYRALSNSQKDHLKFLTEKYANAQGNYPPGTKRMGFRLPTVEKQLNAAGLDMSMLSKAAPSTLAHMSLRDITTTAQDVDEDSGNQLSKTDISGVQDLSLPHYFGSYLDKIDLVSTNVNVSILKYAFAAERNKIVREEMQPVTKVAQEIMRNNTPQVKGRVDSSWLKLFNQMGRGIKRKLGHADADEFTFGGGEVSQASGDNKRLRIFEQLRNMWEYNQLVDPDQLLGSVKMFGREFRLDKILNKARSWKSFQILASLNPIAPFTIAREMANVTNGVFQSVINIGIKDGHVRFTGEQYMSAMKEYTTKHMGDLAKDYFGAKAANKSKFGTMLDYFNVLDGRVFDDTGNILNNKSKIQLALNGDLFFVLQNSAEMFLYSTTFLAYAKSVSVQINGETSTLWDSYNYSEGDVSRMNGIKIDSGKTNEDGSIIYEEFTDVHEQRIRANIQHLLQVTQGNYGKVDRVLLERSWYGAGLLWMKKFFLPFFLSRYGGERWDINNQDFVKGYWLRTVEKMGKKMFNWKTYYVMSGQYKYGIIPEWGGDLTDQEIADIKRVQREVFMILASGAAISYLFGYDDEDEDRMKKIKGRAKDSPFLGEGFNWALYWAMKSHAEMETMAFPGGITEITKTGQSMFYSVFPFERTIKILKNDIDWKGPIPVGLEKTKRKQYGFEKGTYKAYIDLMKLFPSLDLPLVDVPIIEDTKKSRQDAAKTIQNFEAIRRK